MKNQEINQKKIKNLDESLIVLPAHFTNYNDVPIGEKLDNVLNNKQLLKMNLIMLNKSLIMLKTN